ncbi:hypothetical protein PQR62_17185 [Herbaspirillum lusitanum]|uniref:EAL domain-containing protein n=1 Tax=Herbaspirillum lusitanum TaxID=213312 RepID=A0ABW9ACR6_9BURK
MEVIVYQMRKSGVEVMRELFGDEPQNIGDLSTGYVDEADRPRQIKAARLQRTNGDVVLELFDVQKEGVKGAQMVLKGVELRD